MPWGLFWPPCRKPSPLPARPPRQPASCPPCRDAKLSVLHWDAARHELAPSSLHYFEGDASLKAGRTLFPYPPLAVTGACLGSGRRLAPCGGRGRRLCCTPQPSPRT